MESHEKRIHINDNRVLIYNVSDGYVKPTYTVMEGILDNGEVIKSYTLCQWDDYGFNGWNIDEHATNVSFEFDKDHPLYMPLFHLLNYDAKLIIDDDLTRENLVKYLSIYIKDNKIYMDFIDNKDYDKNPVLIDKLYVFVKNILNDGRSKIDQQYLNTKIRLIEFFKDIDDELTNKYHQVSIEENFVLNHSDEEVCSLKKVFKRNYKTSNY